MRGIILSPTRELAVQTLRFVKELSKYTDLRVSLMVGGDSMDDQFAEVVNNPDMCVHSFIGSSPVLISVP